MNQPIIITEADRVRIRARAVVELANTERHTFYQYIARARKGFVWYWHCKRMINVLERVASGELRNVMMILPPRHSKTETVCRLFSGYYLNKYPSRFVGFASFSDDSAHRVNRKALQFYQNAGGQIRKRGVIEWETTEDGGMWAAGAGGTITGKGFHLGLIDDIFKNEEEAFSTQIRQKRIGWYFSTWYDRREPGAAEILVNTRWHANDLIGVLMEEERTNPRHWHIVHFDALKESPPIDVPDTCTLEHDTREDGEALCPERYDVEDLEQIKATQKRFFQTKWQGRPTIPEGDVWKRVWFEGRLFDVLQVWTPTREEPDSDRRLVSDEELAALKGNEKDLIRLTRIAYDWDLAYTEDDRNSASAYCRAGVDREGNIFILDVDFRWLEFPELISWMKSLGGPNYVEKKATGKSAVQVLKRDGIHAEEVDVKGPDKVSRSILATPAAEQKKVWLASHLAEKILDDPRQGILNFPSGKHDDLNDAIVQAINRLFNRRRGPTLTVLD